MSLAFGFSRRRLFNRRSNHQASLVLRLWVAFSSTSPSPSEPSAADISGCPTTIREGRAEIFVDESNSVFYNKAQVNNRGISIAVLRSFILKRREEHATQMTKGEPKDPALSEDAKYKAPRVLEALAASGLRAIRYALEVDGIGEVVAIDNNEVAIEACKKNIQHNSSLAPSKVVPHLADARVYMLTHPKEFDVVDLDPYGSPAMFLDSAVQCVADGGMLMCSATDMAVLAGGNPEVCFSTCGSYPLRGKHCHEMALRILLACIESHAIRHKRYIVPIFSASIVKSSLLKLSHVHQCIGCDSFHLHTIGRINSKVVSFFICLLGMFVKGSLGALGKLLPCDCEAMDSSPGNSLLQKCKEKLCTKDHSGWARKWECNRNIILPNFCPAIPEECSECGHKYVMGRPIWSNPIHDTEWAVSILLNVLVMSNEYPAYAKISAILTSVSEELPDAPLFVNLHNLCATLKCTNPTIGMLASAIRNAGYQISGSHVDPLALKTDDPMLVIWDIMRCWVKLHPVKHRLGNHPGNIILSQEPKLQANFSQVLQLSARRRNPRFVPNPEKYWGPRTKAGRHPKLRHMDKILDE